jgi:hypothetical protein
MKKKLGAWLHSLIQHELEAIHKDLRTYADEVRSDIKGHVDRHEAVAAAVERATQYVDIHKILMATCDHCHKASRRFSISREDGRIVCSDCVIKGIK